MKSEWAVLIISAFTDFVISAGTSLTAAMVATGEAHIPNEAVLMLSMLGGMVAAARTIQPALKAAPNSAAKLKGE